MPNRLWGKKVIEAKSYAASEITALHINASSWNVALSAGSGDTVDIDISGSISKSEEAPAISLSDKRFYRLLCILIEHDKIALVAKILTDAGQGAGVEVHNSGLGVRIK